MAGVDSPRRDPAEREPSYPISSVDNALRLLLRFREQPSVRLSEASRYLGVAESTAHRLLAMLIRHDFVRRDPNSRAYVPGSALMEIGLAVVESLDIRKAARPYLEQLARVTGETAHLGLIEGDRVRFVDAVESDKALRAGSRVGQTLPAHCTSLGRAIMAHWPERELASQYDGRDLAAEALTRRSLTSVEELRTELERTRARGYAVNQEEAEEGIGSVAVPVISRSGRVLAGLSVSAPVTRVRTVSVQREIADKLHEAADALGATYVD